MHYLPRQVSRRSVSVLIWKSRVVLRWDGIFTAYNTEQMCRSGVITAGGAGAASRRRRRRRIARTSRSSGLMLIALAQRKLEWRSLQNKMRPPLYLITTLWTTNYKTKPGKITPILAATWHIFGHPGLKEFRSVLSTQIGSLSEIRMQKVARERTWNRLKGYITISYALCTHWCSAE